MRGAAHEGERRDLDKLHNMCDGSLGMIGISIQLTPIDPMPCGAGGSSGERGGCGVSHKLLLQLLRFPISVPGQNSRVKLQRWVQPFPPTLDSVYAARPPSAWLGG